MIYLETSKADLCDVFREMTKESLPMNKLVFALQKSPYKKIRQEFVTLLSKHINLEGEELDADTISQLGQPASALSQRIREDCQNNTQLLGCLDYVQINIETIFKDVVDRMKMVKGAALQQVVDFLHIACPIRGPDMFDNLPHLLQGIGPEVNLRSVVDPVLHPYIDFVEALDEKSITELVRASHCLGIPTLTKLLGCRVARMLVVLSENAFRKKFDIPEKYRDTTLQKLREIRRQQPWMVATSQ